MVRTKRDTMERRVLTSPVHVTYQREPILVHFVNLSTERRPACHDHPPLTLGGNGFSGVRIVPEFGEYPATFTETAVECARGGVPCKRENTGGSSRHQPTVREE